MTKSPQRSRIAQGLSALAVALVMVALMAASLVLRGRAAIAQSDEARDRGDIPSAIVLAKRAAQARLVGSAYPSLGYERLFALAQGRESAGDVDLAKSAYRAALSAARSTDLRDAEVAARARDALSRLEGKTAPPALEPPPRSQRGVLAAGSVLLFGGLVGIARRMRFATWAFCIGAALTLVAALM